MRRKLRTRLVMATSLRSSRCQKPLQVVGWADGAALSHVGASQRGGAWEFAQHTSTLPAAPGRPVQGSAGCQAASRAGLAGAAGALEGGEGAPVAADGRLVVGLQGHNAPSWAGFGRPGPAAGPGHPLLHDRTQNMPACHQALV